MISISQNSYAISATIAGAGTINKTKARAVTVAIDAAVTRAVAVSVAGAGEAVAVSVAEAVTEAGTEVFKPLINDYTLHGCTASIIFTASAEQVSISITS